MRGQVVLDAVSTWAQGDHFLTTNASVLFFYSTAEMARLSDEEDAAMRSGEDGKEQRAACPLVALWERAKRNWPRPLKARGA